MAVWVWLHISCSLFCFVALTVLLNGHFALLAHTRSGYLRLCLVLRDSQASDAWCKQFVNALAPLYRDDGVTAVLRKLVQRFMSPVSGVAWLL
jgi:hypothetical protein